MFHLPQVAMISAPASLGTALGCLRWWTENISLSAPAHYLANAVFFLGVVL